MFHLGTFRDIPLYLHWSWFLFAGLIAVLHGPFSMLFILGIFLFVALHEYGHCYAAQKCGVEVDDVTLYPMGGVARMRFQPGNGLHEVIIALAGPAVNVVLAILAGIVTYVAYLLQEPYTFLVSVVVLYMNVALVVFNMLPIFPMDGGRVLRGVLSMILDFGSATWWAVRLGQALAVVGIGVGLLLGNVILMVIFFLIIVGAQHELLMAQEWTVLQRIRNKLAEGLNRPELKTATLSQVIEALEDVKNDELRQQFYYDELVPLLKDMEEMEERRG